MRSAQPIPPAFSATAADPADRSTWREIGSANIRGRITWERRPRFTIERFILRFSRGVAGRFGAGTWYHVPLGPLVYVTEAGPVYATASSWARVTE